LSTRFCLFFVTASAQPLFSFFFFRNFHVIFGKWTNSRTVILWKFHVDVGKTHLIFFFFLFRFSLVLKSWDAKRKTGIFEFSNFAPNLSTRFCLFFVTASAQPLFSFFCRNFHVIFGKWTNSPTVILWKFHVDVGKTHPG
jgi:hypothetical protein